MELKNIDIRTFKKNIYKRYKKLFAWDERKSFLLLKKIYKLNLCQFIGVYNENDLIGFMIINVLNDCSYIQLDYFAIFPEYQDKGYGKMALELLKNYYQNYHGILLEIKTPEYGDTKEENNSRKRRKKFYDSFGFKFLNYQFDLYDVIYTPGVFYFDNTNSDEDVLVKEMFKFYNAILGKKQVDKYCSYLCLKN